MKLDSKVSELSRRKKTLGDIGLEIECEGAILPIETAFWTSTSEGSLRNGIEYILRGPISISSIDEVLREFEIVTSKFRFAQSLRTSVHIHVNALEMSLREVYSILGCYWIVENLLVRANGPDRKGNLFCLQSHDAENLVYTVIQEIRQNNYFRISGDNNNRYASLNLSALVKFGSLEFRFIKGTADTKEISIWVKELFNFTQVARRLDLSEFLRRISELEARDILRIFFSEDFSNRLSEGLTEDEVRSWLFEGYCYTFRLSKALTSKKKPKIREEKEDLPKEDIPEDLQRHNEINTEFEALRDLDREYIEELETEREFLESPSPGDSPGAPSFVEYRPRIWQDTGSTIDTSNLTVTTSSIYSNQRGNSV